MSTRTSRVLDDANWWRHAVIYQVYPRSFADHNGDGIGDIPGIIDRLPHISQLGVDALWLSPFYRSPQKDAGYDVSDYCDVDPLFGTLADAERLIEHAHELGLRIIIDIVPNHSSDQHPWFQDALGSEPGSAERARYIFRDGKGPSGELPPNNWESVFGGPAWTRITERDGTPGQWYLHLFDSSQPDFDWTNPEVWEFFRGVLRFWLDRGVDGFRVDVAHGMVKQEGLPDVAPEKRRVVGNRGPQWDQEGVHAIYRDWRKVLQEYGEDRVLCAEAWVMPLEKMAWYIRPDEMHQAFNFGFLATRWEGPALKSIITESLSAFGGVGGPSTWVLSNHDVIRHASRLAMDFPPHEQPTGLGPLSPNKPDVAVGLRRARAATAMMLALPGSSYLYQGEELGLPEVADIPDNLRQDPSFWRTNGERYGRDGCRVPLPWSAEGPSFGFNTTGKTWLPQPNFFRQYARDGQEGSPDSTLELYRTLLATRAEYDLGNGSVTWLEGYPEDILAFRNKGVTVIANTGTSAVTLPEGQLLVSSQNIDGGLLPGDTTAWIRA